MSKITRDGVGDWWVAISVQHVASSVVRPLTENAIDTAVAVDFAQCSVTATTITGEHRSITPSLAGAVSCVRGATFSSEQVLTERLTHLVSRQVEAQRDLSRKANEHSELCLKAKTTTKCPCCANDTEGNVSMEDRRNGRVRVFTCTKCGFSTHRTSKNYDKQKRELSRLALKVTNLRDYMRKAYVSAVVSDPEVQTIVIQERSLAPTTTAKAKTKKWCRRKRAAINRATASLAPGEIRELIKKKSVELQKNVLVVNPDIRAASTCPSCGTEISGKVRLCLCCGADVSAASADALLSLAFSDPSVIVGARSGIDAIRKYGLVPKKYSKALEEPTEDDPS